MNKKITVGVLFGGRSAEHEVSLQSAKNIIEAIDKDKYEIILIGIDKEGKWHLNDATHYLLNAHNPKLIKLNTDPTNLALVPGDKTRQIITVSDHRVISTVDVVFPILHGPYGEDGSVQGLLKLADIPFVGAGILGSAVGMDKDVMKRLLRDAGVPIARFLVFSNASRREIDFGAIVERLGLPFFIKPANLGSSVGVGRVSDEGEFRRSVEAAFQYDRKILIEEYVEGREIECSVLGNEDPIASLPGEVVTDSRRHQFYSYEAKYIDENGAALEIPAQLPHALVEEVQGLAVKTFKVLCCEGMARVDFFVKKDNQVVVNELNTIPGFTKISMYPKLWEASGLSYADLIDRLIQLALERHEKERTLKTSYDP